MRLFKNGFLNDSKGVVAIEFALLMPVFMLLAFGAIEFGVYLIKEQMVVNALTTASFLVQRDPYSGTKQNQILAMGGKGSFIDFKEKNNFICAKSYDTYARAEKGLCKKKDWATDATSSGADYGQPYFVAILAHVDDTHIPNPIGIEKLKKIDMHLIVPINTTTEVPTGGTTPSTDPACAGLQPGVNPLASVMGANNPGVTPEEKMAAYMNAMTNYFNCNH